MYLVQVQTQGMHSINASYCFLFDSNIWNINPLESADIYSRADEGKSQKEIPKNAKNKKFGKCQTYCNE